MKVRSSRRGLPAPGARPPHLQDAPPAPPDGVDEAAARRWVLGLVIGQMAANLLLLVPALGGLRIPLRAFAFGLSIALLALRGRGRALPSTAWAAAVLVLLGCALLNPDGNTWQARAMQSALYVAILAPIFWVPRLRPGVQTLRQMLLVIWAFHLVSASLGILQVRFPGRFQPPVSTAIQSYGEDYVESLQFENAAGERVFRPMGLTDTPGGAATSGFYSALLGAGFLLRSRRWWTSAGCVAAAFVGLSCIFLSHVRSSLVYLVVCLVTLAVLLAARAQLGRLLRFAGVFTFVALAGFALAVSLGGEAIERRMGSLLEGDPTDTYHSNRGVFLELTWDELPRYPLGAGLGHWGMSNLYFGTQGTAEVPPLFVEIQWTGWLYDGGVPLMLTYVLLLFATLRAAARAALSTRGISAELRDWAALVTAYGVGAVALTFSYALFISQSGLEFWLVSSVLLAAVQRSRASAG